MSKVDLKRESERRIKHKGGRKYRRDSKLQELEKQLEFAESRCGTLKQQLDYIKKMYGGTKSANSRGEPSREEGHGDGTNVNQFIYSDDPKWIGEIGNLANREDGDGPEVIQNSVSHSNTTTTNSSIKPSALEKLEQTKKKTSKAKGHFKLLKVKKKVCKKIKKRRRSDDGASSKVSNASSQTQSRIWQDPVVEIYKNSAVNVESESGFDFTCKTKLNKSTEIFSEVLRQRISDKITKTDEVGDESKTKSCNSLGVKNAANFSKEEGMQTDIPISSNKNDLIELSNKEIKTESILGENLKSYCQPTISSKRKRVERDIYSNLSNIKIRNIPFIAARSTAPSHNIGVNIQQVLSIIKKRQPKSENIGSVNDMGNSENPFLALMSTRKMGSIMSQSEGLPGSGVTSSSELKKRGEGLRTSLSHWKSNSEISKEKTVVSDEKAEDISHNNNIINYNSNNSNYGSNNWSFKVDKLKKVLVFLHEDFSSLSQKYKRLQKKLTKRNITKTDAKDELAEIERELEKKEEEITVVIALYKEVLNLREDFKKLQERYNAVACGRAFNIDGLKQSNSTHVQMTALLRKIQHFQDKLKG